MCNKSVLDEITITVVNAAKESLGERLDKVILYGSYARGDFDEYSDIDIMILADIQRENAYSTKSRIRDIIGDIDLLHNVVLSIHVVDCATFYQFMNDLPFYSNVNKEGVLLSA